MPDASNQAQAYDSAPRTWGQVVVVAAQKWLDDDAPTMGAAIAFYTLISLSPVILTVLAVAGLAFGEDTVRAALYGAMGQVLGAEGAETIERLVRDARTSEAGTFAVVLTPILFVLGATTVFVQLQAALNVICKPDAQGPAAPTATAQHRRSWRYARLGLIFVRRRLAGFALIVGAGLLLGLMLAINAVIVGLANTIDAHASLGLADRLWLAQFVVSLVLQTGMFAAIYKILPDVPLDWVDVWTGAALTAILFTIGKLAIGFYLSHAAVASSYGAAGTLIAILFWVYYSTQIFLFGAELTWAWRRRRLALAVD